MDWATVHSDVSHDPEFWRRYFEANPDALHRLLGDIYDTTRSTKDSRPGRKARSGDGTLEDLWDILTVRTSDRPFGEAFLEAAKGRSIRSIAPLIPMHFSHLAGLVNGSRRLVDYNDIPSSMRTLEKIAKSLGQKPAYFREWRELYVIWAVKDAVSVSMDRIARNLG